MKKAKTKALLSLLAAALCLAPPALAADAVAVKVIRPETRTVEQSTEIFGSFQAPDRSMVGSNAAGTLQKLYADEGDKVKKGQVLAELDPADYRLALDQATQQLALAKAQVDQAEAGMALCETNLKTAEADLARIRPVVESGSFPRQKLDHAQNAFDAATAARSQATAALAAAAGQEGLARTQLAMARKKLADCKIPAPFDGVVSQRLANLGEWIMPGKPVFAVERIDPIEAKGDLSEVYLSRAGLAAPVLLSVDGAAGGPWETEITEIAPVADPRTRTVAVTAGIPNPKGIFKPGMSARMKIVLDRRADALVIPSRCLLPAEGEARDTGRVFIVEEGKARLREIGLGEPFREWAVVTSGLSDRELVVSWGQSKLRDGAQVTVTQQNSGEEK